MENIRTSYPSILLILLLLVGSVYTSYIIATEDIIVGPLVIAGLSSLLFLGWMVRDYKIGIYVTLIICVFMSFSNRMLDTQIPWGVPVDILAVISFFIMLITTKEKTNWSILNSPITYIYTAIVVYQLLQVFNPNATSFGGWLIANRANTSFLLFFVFFRLFSSIDEVKKFTKVWLVLFALIGFYGIWQEVFGMNRIEMAWLEADPVKLKLFFTWGHLRVFSFLSDPSIYGLTTAFAGLACFVLMLGPFNAVYRIFFGIMAIIMWVAMSFSGTRTATAMVAVGVIFYVIITLKSRTTLIVMVALVVCSLGIFFGPFYGGTINRIRSTFNTSEDASMAVRDYKRIGLQQYIHRHPIGGGLNTTGGNGLRYSPGHELAGGWDPDSGYLLIALELGWIGLILGMTLFLVTILKGINNYFATDDPLVKTITLTYLVPFVALSAAHYTQDAMFQKPLNVIVIASYALMLTLPTFRKPTIKNSQTL